MTRLVVKNKLKGMIRSGTRGTKGPPVEKPLPKYSDVKRAIQPPKETAMTFFLPGIPKTFKIGDTMTFNVDDELTSVTWLNKDTLLIEPGGKRRIIDITTDGISNAFVCSDTDDGKPTVGLH
jgi:hypothetical protein